MFGKGGKRSPAPQPIGTAQVVGYIVQVLGGIAVGGMVGFRLYPMAVYEFQRAFGITDGIYLHAPASYGLGTTGYWMSWIITFIVICALCVAASLSRHTRLFGMAAGASFALIGVHVAWFFIAFDFGDVHGPS
ncbi:hypothetical protein ACIG56_14490 [Nocardia fusca]|uniref:hypothetical protein n=1 Tax=Nocardia fusca TaxID=941183 RepID=UPI0037C9D04E